MLEIKGKKYEVKNVDFECTVIDYHINENGCEFTVQTDTGNEFGKNKYYVHALYRESSVTVTLEEQTGFGPTTKCIYSGRLSEFNIDKQDARVKAYGYHETDEDFEFLWIHDDFSDKGATLMFDQYVEIKE